MSLFSKKEIRSDITLHKNGKQPTCISCGLFMQCQSSKIPAIGTGAKGIMNVFDYPTKKDDINASYLSESAGKELKRLFSGLGIDFNKDCVNVYAVRCKPYKDGEEREPAQKEIESCRVKLFEEIRKRKPKMIIAFGKLALQSLIGHKWLSDFGSIDKWRGWIIPDQKENYFIAPIYSYNVLDGEKDVLKNIFRNDLSIALKHYNTPFPVQKKPEITVLKNLKPLKEIKYATVAIDYETTGLKPHEEGHRIICASVATSPDNVYVFMMPKDEEKREPFIDLLKNKNIKKMAHNMKFEETWSQIYLGTKVRNWYWDSMQAAHILDNRPDISSLKFQAYVQFGIAEYNEDVKKWIQASDNKNANAKNKIEEYIKNDSHKELLLEYCALDSIYEYRLAKQQQEQFSTHILPF